MVCVASWKKGERFFHVHTILDRRRGEKKGVAEEGGIGQRQRGCRGRLCGRWRVREWCPSPLLPPPPSRLALDVQEI